MKIILDGVTIFEQPGAPNTLQVTHPVDGVNETNLFTLQANDFLPQEDVFAGKWFGQYWSNTNFIGEPLERADDEINFDWGLNPAFPSWPDAFSAKWQRPLDLEVGTYRLDAGSDDGMRVYVDDVLVINDWASSAYNVVTYNLVVTDPRSYYFKIEYYDGGGAGRATFTWTKIA